MSKAKAQKQPTKEDLEDAFETWSGTLDALVDSAEKSFMPLLADVFRLGKKILGVYEKAFSHALEEQE